jgi:hypothetical protein
MSLYVGPTTNQVTSRTIVRSSFSRVDNDLSGWILTGDAELRNCDRRAEWIKFLTDKRLPSSVGTLMLPHHGSANNFHSEILRALPKAELFVTANARDPLRPHADVKDEVAKERGQHARIAIVATKILSELSARLPIDATGLLRHAMVMDSVSPG